MLALGRDDELVPIVLLDKLVCLVFRIALENAAALLLIEQAPVAVGDVRLRSRNDSIISTLTSELNARVTVANLDLGLQDEVAVRLLGCEELVLLEVALGLSDDHAVFN